MIIIKGRARADGGQLAAYLTKKGDNGRVELIGRRGLAGDSLRVGLRLAEAEAEQSRGRKPLWHAQINPAEGVRLTREQQMMAVETLERHLGFAGLPRAVVLHEKDGREHLHVVWSRFDRETGKLRRDDFSHKKNVAAAAEVAERFGLEANRNPFVENQAQAETLTRQERRERSKTRDTHAEQQQDKRATKTRAERRAEITELWRATDSGQAFRAALDEAGYTLARGWRGYVVVDGNGVTHSLARQIDGARAKDVRARFADLDPGSILSAKEIKAAMRQARQDRAREIAQAVAGQPAPVMSDPVPDPAQRPDKPKSEGAEVARASPESIQRPSYAPENPAALPKTPEIAPSSPASAGEEVTQQITAADVLALLTRHHSTFTRQDLAREVDRNTGGGGNEPWMMKAGGLDALDDSAKASAERSYAQWADDNPELAARFGIGRYVSYVQGKQAERDAANPDALKARQDSKAAFDTLMAEVEALPELIRLGPDQQGRERFTSRDMLDTELTMQGAADRLAQRTAHAVPDKLRDAVPGMDTLGSEQRAALEYVTNAGDLALVVGFAGTGKSRTLGVAREAWEAAGYRVRGAALSGIAAESLQNDAGIQSRTLHSLLHQLDTIPEREAALADVRRQIAAVTGEGRGSRRERAYLNAKAGAMSADLDATRLTDRDVIVIDEAGMVGSRQMARVLTAAEKTGAKVVLVGDAEQLQAVDAGAAFRSLAVAHGAQEITQVRRQREAWQREATHEFGRAKTAEALARYHEAGLTHQAETRDQAKAELVSAWTTARQEQPARTQIILAYTSADVAELNELARAGYRAEGRLGEDVTLATAAGSKSFATGDRMYFTRNDTRLGVKNGSLGSVEQIEDGRMTVALDAGRTVAFDVADYGHITHGYAATVHKSQGVTVDRAHVLASRYMDRHAAYVGMTRHRDRADLYFGADEFKSFDSLARRMSRSGAKDTTLDYTARAERGEASDSLRAAVGEFWQRERPDVPRPAWTDRPAPQPAQEAEPRKPTQQDRPTTLADQMRAARNAAEPEGKKHDQADARRAMIDGMRARMTPEERARHDQTLRDPAEKLRQELRLRRGIGGPSL